MSAKAPGQTRKLPPGRHGIPADQVADDQRGRILNAVAGRVSEAGYANSTVADFIQRAGVSRKTFYQHFTNKEAAFLAAYDQVADRVLTAAQQGYAAQDDFAASSREALAGTLRELAADPDATVLAIVEVFAAGPAALERRAAIIGRLTELITERTENLPETVPGAGFTAETVVGAVLEVIYNRVRRGEADRLPELLPDLLYCVLAPFIGHDRAADERTALLAH